MTGTITLHLGDITADEHADAIVTAANAGLRGGGGVDGAVHRAAGPQLLQECRRLGGCEVGEARITGAGRLAAGYVIHAVGPVWRGGGAGEARLLGLAYTRALALAARHGCRRVALPAISTGVYGYPLEDAAAVAIASVQAALRESAVLLEARLWLFDRAAYAVFSAALEAAEGTP